MSPLLIISIAVGYILTLFWVAFYTERKGQKGSSLVNNPYTYALSLSVFCTAWTFYGSVGEARSSGLYFLGVYIGPALGAILFSIILSKIIHISKTERITSIADFISSRYGKSTFLGIVVVVVSIFSIIPYISIQLKAIALTYDLLLLEDLSHWSDKDSISIDFYKDSAWYIAIALAIFTILFGTRRLDPSERHEGLVASVAFEAIVKLIAFLAIGIYVTYILFDGFSDIFTRAYDLGLYADILIMNEIAFNGWNWFWLVLISMLAIFTLPRQFHISVVENTNPELVQKASWLFPLYLLLINVFVLPIALGGLLNYGPALDGDTYVLSLPLMEGNLPLALLVAIGGFSAATSMVIIAVTSLSIMISNNLIVPSLLRTTTMTSIYSSDISGKLLGIRRVIIIMVLIVSYGYYKFVSANYTIVSIGLISFVGVAQFAPPMIGGIFWKNATRRGAISGLITGFIVWMYTLTLPTLVETGLISPSFMDEGLMGISWLRPYHLFGMQGLNHISHGAFWSLTANVSVYIWVSLFSTRNQLEIIQADLFVDIEKYRNRTSEYDVIKRQAVWSDISLLLHRILGKNKTAELLKKHQDKINLTIGEKSLVQEDFIRVVETHLAGAVGAASAKTLLHSVVKSDPINLEEMLQLLEQTQEIVQYSKALEVKSQALEKTTAQLKSANARLQDLDKMKADFISTVTHELRTPITSIKALSRILLDHKQLPEDQQQEYFSILVSESDRMSKLINQVLDLKRLEEAHSLKEKKPFLLNEVTRESYLSIKAMATESNVEINFIDSPVDITINGSSDKIKQAILNLLSNAIKFADKENGKVRLELYQKHAKALIFVTDNGTGIELDKQKVIFEKFTQLQDDQFGKPQGSGLGLTITKDIITKHKGTINIKSNPGKGSTFIISLPVGDPLK